LRRARPFACSPQGEAAWEVEEGGLPQV